MKNRIILIVAIILLFFKLTLLQASEQFNFDITEVEVTKEGNFFKGLKRGTATTNENQTIITADIFEYDKITNILKAKGNVIIEDKIKDFVILSEHITYFKNEEKIFSKGETSAKIQSKYDVLSSDLNLDNNTNILTSQKKTIITDDEFTKYETDLFNFSIIENIFKGTNVKVSTNNNLEENEQEFYNFKDGIFDLESKDFVASDTKIYVKKNIFDESENDPRIYGKSSKKSGNITRINKGVFTSCKLTDSCPPWSIKAKNITHDQDKRDVIYKNPILRVYDFPIVYFPKFTHPDPTVERRSGFLTPQLNHSNTLGSSLFFPYFNVISDEKDITFKPRIFDSNIYMFQNEYRQKNTNSNFIADFSLTKGYQSNLENDNQRNNISHLFAKFSKEFNVKNLERSSLNVSIQKITKDTYLKVFESNLNDFSNKIKPSNNSKLTSSINLQLDADFSLDTGFKAYETLSGLNSDRYRYVLPYYNFSKIIYKNDFLNLDLKSSGNNNLYETNKLKSVNINDLSIGTKNFFSNIGFKNNLNLFFKNKNSLGKNIENQKSSPEMDLLNLVQFDTSLPLLKYSKDTISRITPRLSMRFNPGEMSNNSDIERSIDVNNIFSTNRLGFSETFEQGKSLTLGLQYKKESIMNINKYFDFKLAGVLRDVEENNIPLKTSLNQKASNLFGGANLKFSEFWDLNYKFSLDNDLNTFEQNYVKTSLNFDRITTGIKFFEDNGKMGDTNVLENFFTMNYDEYNFLTFKTRKNRKLNLTEYYDLVYEYKNDCLTAGVKYKKTYYSDRDLRPREDMLFTITFFPITQYEQKVDDSLYRNLF